MKNKPQANRTDRTNIDLGQKEAAMEKLGKDKMSHMGAHEKLGSGEKPKTVGDTSKTAGDTSKPGTRDHLQH